MAEPQDREARLFYRVAYQRLEDADLIRRLLRRPQTAVYIGGYAVECALKSLLLARTPAGRRAAVLATFRGGQAHDYDWLQDQLRQANVTLPNAVRDDFRLVNTWSTALRYSPASGDDDTARDFIDAAGRIVVAVDAMI